MMFIMCVDLNDFIHCCVISSSPPLFAVSLCGGKDDDENSVDIYDGLDSTPILSGKFTEQLKSFIELVLIVRFLDIVKEYFIIESPV